MPSRRLFTCGVLLFGLTLGLIVGPRLSRSWFQATSDSAGVLREVRLLKELVTVRYTIQKVTGLRQDAVPFGSESILLIVQAKVLGGVDLGELTERDTRIQDRHHVAIFLPPPQILHIYLDEKQTRVWDRTKTWWTPWVPYDLDLEKRRGWPLWTQ